MFACCARDKTNSSQSNDRHVPERTAENTMGKSFGDTFQGTDPERRKRNAEKYAEDCVSVMTSKDFDPTKDIAKIKPEPIFIVTVEEKRSGKSRKR